MKANLNTIYYDVTSGAVRRESSEAAVADEATLRKQIESNVVGIYPDFTFQTVEGFGCAMTETACYLLSKMEPEIRSKALKCWFGPEGVDARFIRIPLDSCDYSLSEYQAVSDPIADPELKSFSMERNRQYIIPVVKEALALSGGKLSALVSPWSPPVQWKTAPELTSNDLAVYGQMGLQIKPEEPSRCFGGRLKKEYYPAWAKYLVKYILAYLKEGIPVTMLSVQNEASAATTWDSCLWTGEEESIFLRDHLYPAMKAAGLTEKVGIFIWDHNKERMIEHIEDMMQNGIEDMVAGFAYHWYSGDHFDALSMLRNRYPDKIFMHSESCGLHIPGKATAYPVPEEMIDQLPEPMRSQAKIPPLEMDYIDAANYAHDLIGDLNHGMERWIDWNLCVDTNGGPRHVPGGFAAPIVATEDGSFQKTVSYSYIREVANIFLPGSTRIGVTTFSDTVEATAALRPDGSFGVVLLNKQDMPQEINLRFRGQLCTVTLPAKTLSSVVISL